MRAFIAFLVLLSMSACGDDRSPATPEGPTLTPGHVWIVSGDGQEGETGTVAPEPIGIAVEARSGVRIPGIAVTFTVIEGDAEVESPVLTNDHGLALAEVVFGQEPGSIAILASLDGIADPPPFTMRSVAP